MKKIKILSLLMVLPLLASCGETDDPEFVPEVPIENFTPTGLKESYVNKNPGNPNREGDIVTFDILEDSDYHGAIAESDKEVGIAKYASYVQSIRDTNPGGTVLISGGDMWQGTADSNLTRGQLMTYSMNVMGYDSMSLGNHEFDWTESFIKNNKDRAMFPFLAANLYDTRTNKVADFVKEYEVIERGEYKIGIIGTIGDSVKSAILASSVEHFEFKKESQIIGNLADKLREEEKCDIVIWSSHKDLAEVKSDLAVAGIEKFDAVFSGHTHSDLVDEVNGLPIVETSAYGRGLAHVKLEFNVTTKEVRCASKKVHTPLENASSLTPNADINALIAQYNEKYIAPVKSRRLGNFNDDFSTSDLCNVAVAAMYKRTTAKFDTELRYIAAVHNNNGGVRKSISKGTVTYGTIYETFPFDNEICYVPVKGRKLISLLTTPNNLGYYHEAGLKSEDIDRNSLYYVLGTDFLLGDMLATYVDSSTEVIYTGLYVRDLVAETIKLDKNVKRADYSGSNFGIIK